MITGDDGIATATLILDQSPVPAYTVKTEFEGDDTSMPATDEDPFDILQEKALTEYTGQEFVGEQNPDVSTTPLILSATVTDTDDSYRGDIRNASVQFYDVNTLDPLSGWLTPGLVVPGDLTQGLVSCTWNAPVPTSGYNTFTIGIKVGIQNPENNGYYAGSDKSVINVFRTDLYEFISGGGHIIPDMSKGEYASDPGRKVNFGFNIKWNKTMKRLQGNLNIVFRIGEKTYQIKTNSLSSLSINSNNPCSQEAYFTSKANLTDITTPEVPHELKGNLDLQAKMTNNTSPGDVSTIGFTIYDGNNLLYSSNWPVSKTEELALAGGNIVVHNGITCVLNNEVDVMLYSSRNPSVVGEEVIFEAIVTPKGSSLIPEGKIIFRNDVYQMASVDLINGKATFATSELKEGTYNFTAEYVPMGYFEGNTSNLVIQEVLGSVLTVVSSKNPSQEGEPVTFTATVTVPPGYEIPKGSVTFKEGETILGAPELSEGTASVTMEDLTPGDHSISAEYIREMDSEPLIATIIQQVISNVSIQLTSSKNPEQVNNTVIFKATVTSSGSPVEGVVIAFYLNGEEMNLVSTDANGVASANKTFTATGTFLMVARYAGQTASLSQVIKNKVKSAEIATASGQPLEPVNVKVYPNPFDERLLFEFTSPETAYTRIEIYDMTGRHVETVFDQLAEAGIKYSAEFKPEKVISAMYIYRITMGEAIYIGKALYNNRN